MWPAGGAVRVRIGLHTGEPALASEGYVGMDVHHAARIKSARYGGQVLLSQTTRDLVEHHLPDGVSCRDMGEHRLKDLQRPSHLFQLVVAGLPADFPPLNTLDAYPNNLPVQLTPLIGREREMVAMEQLLHREDVHLVTLTGPGGTGKTRLALQVAADLSDLFPDGIYFVDLAPVSDPTLVIPIIAQALGLREEEKPLSPGASQRGAAAEADSAAPRQLRAGDRCGRPGGGSSRRLPATQDGCDESVGFAYTCRA
jgi:hypothetical protein